jgi:predicted TIM-barrel fold metal-dependent hydrolase
MGVDMLEKPAISGGVKVDPRLGYAAFDADAHYYEAEDSLTRYLPKEMKIRGAKWAEINGRRRLMLGNELFTFIPNALFDPVAKPGCLHDYFAADLEKGGGNMMEQMGQLEPIRPEYRDRDARLKVLDEQGIAATWMFPTLGVTLEMAMLKDIDAMLATFTAFNRWLLDDWGYNYKERIYAAPMISLADPDWAVKEVERLIADGAKLITMRNGLVHTRTGTTSPAAPEYDPFWARVEEANLIVAPHTGDDGYEFLTHMWEPQISNKMLSFTPLSKVVSMQRAVYDFFGAIICHRLFERFPRLRFACIENGAGWIKPLYTRLHIGHAQTKGWYQKNPIDQFREHVWLTPFWEDKIEDVLEVLPVERILFGSDWPHVEGVEAPMDFLNSLLPLDDAQRRLVMRDNAAALTATANA